jgi:GPI transamidase subunit PIG-U
MRVFPLLLILFAGTATRLALFALLPSSTLRKLETRVELASPSTSFKSLSEAIYLLRLQKAGADGKLAGGEEVIRSPSPWQSGHVHHSPLSVHALSPFIETQEAFQIAPLAKEKARREKEKLRKAAEQLRLRQMQRSQHPDSIDSPKSPLLRLQLLLSKHTTRVKSHHYLWVCLDLLAAVCLALIEAQRASWRAKYARIRGAREVELELVAQDREAREKTISSRHGRGKKEGPRKDQSSLRIPDRCAKVAALYLFNPLSLLSNLALSSISVYNLLTLFSVLLAVTLAYTSRSGPAARRKGQSAGSSLSLSSLVLLVLFASAVSMNIVASLYPVLLLPPLLLLATSNRPGAASSSVRSGHLAILILAVLASLGLFITQSTATANLRDVFKQVYLHLILATDLAPNIGLWWYFFIEMFDHFRNFFLLAFNVHLISYVAPLSIKYR